MHPPLAPAPEGRVIFSPPLAPTHASEQLWPPEMPIYIEPPLLVDPPKPTKPERPFSQIQERLRAEWVPVRGETPVSEMVAVFKEKAIHLELEAAAMTPDELAGNMDPEKRRRVIRKISAIMTGAVDILTEYGFDVDQLISDKLDVVDVKYDPDMFTEQRIHGFNGKPGRRNVREVARAMKYGYDKNNKTQSYQLRGLVIPVEEETARFGDLTPFVNWHQMRVAEWQYRAFGSDFSVEQSIMPNMIGEMKEFLDEFDKLNPEQIDHLQVGRNRDDIGEEGADFLIGAMGVLAAWYECVQGSIDGKITTMKHDFKLAPILRTEHNYSAPRAMRELSEAKYRLKHGKPVPYKLVALLHAF